LVKLVQKPALSSRPTAVDDSLDPTDEEMIEYIISGIRDQSVSIGDIMRNIKEIKRFIATNPIDPSM
jgi:hypothetical protein